MEPLRFVSQAAEFAKIGACRLGVEGPGWDCHEAYCFDRVEPFDRGEQGREVGGGEAVLRLFVAELYFDQDGELFSQGRRGGVETLGDLERIDGVDGVEELCGAGGFVGLEGADKVELGVGQGCEVARLFLELLDAVLAEEAVTCGVGLEDGLDGMDLADGHEGYVAGGAVGLAAGVGYLVVQAAKVVGDGHASGIAMSNFPANRGVPPWGGGYPQVASIERLAILAPCKIVIPDGL